MSIFSPLTISLIGTLACLVGVLGLFLVRKSQSSVVGDSEDSLDDIEDDGYDNGVIHSSSSSDSSNYYPRGDDDASIAGSVSLVSRFGGLFTAFEESVSAASGASSEADTFMSHEVETVWSDQRSMAGTVATSAETVWSEKSSQSFSGRDGHVNKSWHRHRHLSTVDSGDSSDEESFGMGRSTM